MRSVLRTSLVAGQLLVSAHALAHGGHVPVGSERTLKFEVDGELGLRLVVTVNHGPEEMLRLTRRADANGDGAVSEAESLDFLEEWTEEIRRELPLRVDGGFRRVSFGDPFFDPKGPISLRAGTLELVGRLVLSAGRHAIFVSDEAAPDAYERTDVMFSAANDGVLVASGPEQHPTEIVPSFDYGAKGARRRVHAIGVVVEIPQPPGGELPKRRSVGKKWPTLFLLTQAGFAVLVGRLIRAIRARDRARGKRR